MRSSTSARLPGADQVWAACCVAGATALLAVLVTAARHGFDFTDEGFYLNAIAHEAEGARHTSFFGETFRMVTGPLSGAVVWLRWFNLALVAVAGATLGWAVASSYPRGRGGRWTVSAVVATTSAAGLGLFGTGLMTPSYNSLSATGVLLVAAGLVRSLGEARNGPVVVPALLIGLGGVVTFLGRPSAAVATALVAALALLADRQSRRILLPALVIAGLGLLVASWVLTGSPVGVVPHVWQAVGEARTLGAGHDLDNALSSFGLPRTSAAALRLFAVLLTAGFVWGRSSLAEGRQRVVWLVLAVLVTGLGAVLVSDRVAALGYAVPTRAVVLLGAPFGLLVAALVTRGPRVERSSIVVAVALLLLPHAWVFGSNNDYWHAAALLYVLWFAGGLVLVAARVGGRSPALTLAAAPVLLLTAAVVAGMLVTPYRQVVPYLDQEDTTRVGAVGEVLLAPDFARAVDGFRESAHEAGFEAGTPVLDLTGQMPGLIYALDGIATGAPWIIGGYPGSDEVARRTLSRTSCATLARSWLLVERNGTRAIDPAALAVAGATLDDWEPVTSQEVTTAVPLAREVTLLRPDSGAERREAECEAAR